MEKKIGIIINEQVYQWQNEAIERIEMCGFKVTIFSLPGKAEPFSKDLQLSIFLEAKILRSSNKYLQVKSINSSIIHPLRSVEELISKLDGGERFNYLISLICFSENELTEISKRLTTHVLQLSANVGEALPLAQAVAAAYKNGESVINVSLKMFTQGTKSVQYESCNSIEHGLLLRSMNSTLAKSSLIYQRFLENKLNAGNVISSDGIATFHHGSERSYLGSFISHLFDKVYYKRQWILLYQTQPGQQLSDINSFKTHLPPASKFWADPFVVHHDNEHYVFIEELDNKSNKGFISYCKVENDMMSEPLKIIDTSYHLSFPNVFKFENVYYMIPESSAANNIQLWCCNEFPDKWELHKVMIDNIKAVDSVVKYIHGKWWLFCTVKPLPDVSGNEELCVFYADSPLSDQWISHPKNPVCSDARLGRNAGKIEMKDGRYFRYGQYSGYGYGKAITKSEIIKISETEYQEKLIEMISPETSKGFDNLHTFNSNSYMTVGDALRRVRRFF